MSTKAATLMVQKWGNSLAVRIPAGIARQAHFHSGTPVELSFEKGNVIVKSVGDHKLTLKERLERFDLKQHGGEVMRCQPIGLEKLNDK